MMHLPGLNLLERAALWVLVRSPRTSLVAVKELHWPTVFVAANPADPVAANPAGPRVGRPPGPGKPTAPQSLSGGWADRASMTLERLFHLPSYGEKE
jgi:hypothetical protein